MADSTVWWLLAGGAVALELLTGTFYLVMVAVGMAAGALAAHAGGSLTTQLATAGLVAIGAISAWYLQRRNRPGEPPAEANRDVNLDVGETVVVQAWAPDHTATVRYRGANWTVVPFGGTPQGSGPHRVREVAGSRLVVERIRQENP
jgi:membrane protein implicated in regulation of membrane protease activity